MGIRAEETESEMKSEVGESETAAVLMSWCVGARLVDSEFDI